MDPTVDVGWLQAALAAVSATIVAASTAVWKTFTKWKDESDKRAERCEADGKEMMGKYVELSREVSGIKGQEEGAKQLAADVISMIRADRDIAHWRNGKSTDSVGKIE